LCLYNADVNRTTFVILSVFSYRIK